MPPPASPSALSQATAEQAAAAEILAAFDSYKSEFMAIVQRARRRFESRDWPGHQSDASERDGLYERALEGVAARLEASLSARFRDRAMWARIKDEIARLTLARHDSELAETFYNSVTRKVFATVGLDRDIEFFYLESLRRPETACGQVSSRYAGGDDTRRAILELLREHGFEAAFEDVGRDAERVAREIDLHLWPLIGNSSSYAIEVIDAPFFRNKVAYLIGRIQAGHHVLPLVLPLYHGEDGVFVDTVLLDPAEVSIVFSFAFSSFHVEVEWHDEVIAFLKSILPEKPLGELYNALGFERQGKTELYRDLHRFIHESRQQFVIAPGKEGAVMIAFTLPEYNYVYKVIKDAPCFLRSAQQPPKGITRAQVMAQYDFVRRRDRVGRIVETQDFENMRFRLFRFADNLIRELNQAAGQLVTVDPEFVVFRHLYAQRRVIPLPMYLEQERDAEVLRQVILDFGYFFKDLAAAGIFPSDLFNTWNYGVTRRRRIVLFDYDDVIPIERATFTVKDAPRDEHEELVPDEERLVAGPHDFFVDEMRRYSGIPRRLLGIFEEEHGDLFQPGFWTSMQERVAHGEVVDIAPYDRRRRFARLARA